MNKPLFFLPVKLETLDEFFDLIDDMLSVLELVDKDAVPQFTERAAELHARMDELYEEQTRRNNAAQKHKHHGRPKTQGRGRY